MTLESSIAFLIAMFVLAATPGPGMLATTAQALVNGFRSSCYTIAGIVLGDILYLTLAFWGLSALAYSMGNLFFPIKLAGGAYLIYMGWTMWRSDIKRRPNAPVQRDAIRTRQFLTGLVVTIGNPKVIFFYVAFLPNFMNLTAMNFTGYLTAVGIVTVVLTIVLGSCAYASSYSRRFLTTPRSVKNINRGGGAILFGAGIVMIAR